MVSVARTKLETRAPASAPSTGCERPDRPDLARQVAALAEANARLDARARALDERRRLLEAAIEALDQNVSVYDHDLRLVAWSGAFARELDGSLEGLAGQGARLIDVLRAMAGTGGGPSDAPLPHYLERIAATERALQERRLWPDGRIIELLCLPLSEDSGRVLVKLDVTERASAAAERQRIRRELEQFVAIAAHDLQAPLAHGARPV